MKLENIPCNLDASKIFNYFKNETNVFVGKIKLIGGDALVPMRLADLQVTALSDRVVSSTPNVSVRISSTGGLW